MLEQAIKWSTPGTDEKAVVPPPIPEGVSGFWDPEQRIFRSRYLQPLAFGKTVYSPKEVTTQLSLRDVFDVVHFLRSGKLFAFFDRFGLLIPPSRHDALIYQFEYDDVTYNLSVVYRGCPFPYEYPFRPSAFRRFSAVDTGFEELKRYVSNLVIESAWITWQVHLKPVDVETIIQQFKILPWTFMVDVTYDLNVAVGFALTHDMEIPDHIPCIYQLLVMQPDTYEIGAHSVWKIPNIARLKQQRALSFIGFSETMADPHGFVISLNEYVLASKRTGYGWHWLGFENVRQTIEEIEEKLRTQRNWLFPPEEKEVHSFVHNVVQGIRRKYTTFELRPDLLKEIDQRLGELEDEMSS